MSVASKNVKRFYFWNHPSATKTPSSVLQVIGATPVRKTSLPLAWEKVVQHTAKASSYLTYSSGVVKHSLCISHISEKPMLQRTATKKSKTRICLQFTLL